MSEKNKEKTTPDLPLVAYPVHPASEMELAPAPRRRGWMDATHLSFANRCLPMLMANQAGWVVLNDHPLRVHWDGGNGIGALSVLYLDEPKAYQAVSMFGYGIVTFTMPFLFRTPPGWNLLARGPANLPKDGIQALEGLIETDWAVATFTMNWQMTRPGHTVTFEKGEPICMIVPQRRHDLESFAPRIGALEEDPGLAESFQTWAASRFYFRGALATEALAGRTSGPSWQKHYFQGQSPSGDVAPEHLSRMALRPFRKSGDPE